MNATAEALWLRALQVVGARGLLPAHRSPLTPGELAAEAARRGEDRLLELVVGWYYPASYGQTRGVLSDEDAARLVAALESGIAPREIAPTPVAPPVVEKPRPARRPADCELCGSPLTTIVEA